MFRCVDHFLLRETAPVKRVAHVLRDTRNKLPLGSAVAFAKRMQRVYFAKVVRGAFRELLTVQAL